MPTYTTPFFAFEQDIHVPISTTPSPALGFGTRPFLTISAVDPSLTDEVLYASDMGYRTKASDPDGVVAYPARIQEAFQIEVQVDLDLNADGVSASWGTLTLANTDNRYDSIITSGFQVAGLASRILYGEKAWETTRGIYTDPAYGTLSSVFTGIAQPPSLTDLFLRIPLRDASYWLERQINRTLYGGTGTLDGTAVLKGVQKPMIIGAARASISNITPVLVDPAYLIYQVNQGPGYVTVVYEGGYSGIGGIVNAGDVSDLYSGTTAAGFFRTNGANGLFQLGSSPARQITCDVQTGDPSGPIGSIDHPTYLARFIMESLCAMPAAFLSGTTAGGLDYIGPNLPPYDTQLIAGLFLDPQNAQTGIDLLAQLLTNFGTKLVTKRDGKFYLYYLAALDGNETPADTLNSTNVISIVVETLPPSVAVPIIRARTGYQFNWTLQTSDLSSLISDDRKQYLSQPRRLFEVRSPSAIADQVRPNDPDPYGVSLIGDDVLLDVSITAQAFAQDRVNLWGVRRRLYSIDVPFAVGIALDIGDVVTVTMPFDDLVSGQNGQIVGYRHNSGDASITLRVLI